MINLELFKSRFVRRAAMLLFAVTALSHGAWAQNVDQESAKQKAKAFMTSKMGMEAQKSLTAANSGVRSNARKTSKKGAAERDYLYVFNIDGGGYVVVSGDDRTEEILGYSTTGTFDADKIPDNMRAFLQEYVDGIKYLDDHDIQVTGTATRTPNVKAGIKPLLTTRWDQWAPYNIYCPQITEEERGLTGCDATALAQIMYYHQWPATSTEIPAYTSERRKIAMPAIEPTTIDWANMKDTYTCYKDVNKTEANATESEKAVAKLMQLCGQALEMDYGIAEDGGSSAYTDASVKALVKYFDYEEETVKSIQRYNYSYSEWQDIIYNELANRRPVLYTGQSTGGGHMFVCDGYDSDDFFHINWGWSGGADDYFRLRLLNPYTQGAGGSTTNEGFGVAQDAVIGIQKNDGISVERKILSLYGFELLNSTTTRTDATEDFDLSGLVMYYFINSDSSGPYHFDLGVRITDSSDNTILEECLFDNELPVRNYICWNYLPDFGKDMPDGTYKLYFIDREFGTTTWQICKGVEEYPILLTISGNTLTVTLPNEDTASIEDLDAWIELYGTPVVGGEMTFTITVKNNSSKPFRQDIYYDVNEDEYFKPAGYLEVEGGETTSFSFKYNPQTEGLNCIRLLSYETSTIWGDFTFTVKPKPTTLTVTPVNKFFTFSSDVDVKIPDGIEVFKCKLYKNGAAIDIVAIGDDELGGIIKANNGVLLRGTPGVAYDFVPDSDIPTFTDEDAKSYGSDNLLEPVLEARNYAADEYYVLKNNEFHKIMDNTSMVSAHKAVLHIPVTVSAARRLSIIMGEATGIEDIDIEKADEGRYHDLQGRRVESPEKPGLYIRNGKKVIIK